VYWVGVSPWCPLEGSLRFLAAGVVRRPCFVPFPSESAELARLGGRPHHLGLLHLVVSSLSCAVAVATDFLGVSSGFDRGFQRSWSLGLEPWALRFLDESLLDVEVRSLVPWGVAPWGLFLLFLVVSGRWCPTCAFFFSAFCSLFEVILAVVAVYQCFSGES